LQGSQPNLKKAQAAAQAALDKKALEPVLLDLSEEDSYTDYLLVVSARSDRQVRSIADSVTEALIEQAISKTIPAVVEVQNVGVGLGSGVVISSAGYIVTNNHVVANGKQFQVVFADGSSVPAKLVGADPVDDLAIVQVHAAHLAVATLGDSSMLRVGETVLALGNPLGIAGTATNGIISALNRTVNEGQGGGSILNAVQTSAAINPGNSGGALINLGGQVVGIPTLAAVDPEFNAPATGIGFAIPSNTVRRIADQLMRSGKVTSSGRASLGIYGAPVTQQVAAQYNLPVDHGVVIGRLVANGPAQKAGLKAGDIIVAADGHTITSYDDLLTALAAKKPGDKMKLDVVTASGQKHTYTVTLGELTVNSNG